MRQVSFAPPGPVSKMEPYRANSPGQYALAMKMADRRRVYRSYALVMDLEPGMREPMLPYAVVEDRRVTAHVPASFARSPPEVVCEIGCDAMRRLADPSVPLYGRTAMRYMEHPWFRRQRMWAVGDVGERTASARFMSRKGERMGRMAREFVEAMEREEPFLAALLDVRRIRAIPMAEGASRRWAAWPDPFLGVVFYDAKALDPVWSPNACFTAMLRSCAFIACFDRRTCEVDARRLEAVSKAFPPRAVRGMADCIGRGIRLQPFPHERRPLLHA